MVRKERIQPVTLEIDPASAVYDHAESNIIDRYALRQAMSKLSPEHHEVVVLHELDGLTYEEAAAVLGVPVGTVKSRLHHAFLNLRKSLFPEGGLS
jgi:RNA polymerase sigma-70 factor (ECF subfamily)